MASTDDDYPKVHPRLASVSNCHISIHFRSHLGHPRAERQPASSRALVNDE